ncbi:MAG: efflux RND transporter periplasmic adaptor subunit [Cyclobacteriaceae bacterium]
MWISLTIIVLAAAVTLLIFYTEPEAQRSGAVKETAMLVDIVNTEMGDLQPVVVATGTVQPSRDIMLRPRVNGEIIRISDIFAPGGTISKGQVLLQVDPSDYRNTLALRKSDLSQALSDLNIEQGRQDVARKDYQLIEESMPIEDMDLILREPQLNAVKARVDAARAAVDQAELNLERTTIRAPFDAHIITRNVNLGSQVNPNTNLGRLVGIDTYWVIVNVPLSKMERIRFPDKQSPRGSRVTLRDRKAWTDGKEREGFVQKMIGSLDERTRMARVIVEVEDPLGSASGEPPLIINSFVEAKIEAKPFEKVIRLSRDYIRENQTVWVAENDSLRIKDVNVIFTDANYAYISEGLDQNDQVVTTNLATVTEGAPLRIKSASASEGEQVPIAASERIDENK